MQGSGVALPFEIHHRALCLGTDIIRCDGQQAIPRRFCVSIMPQTGIIKRSNLLQQYNVARVELNGALEGSSRLFVASLLAPLNVTRQLESARIVRQIRARRFQFSQSAVIIAISVKTISRGRPMRLPRTREQTSR